MISYNDKWILNGDMLKRTGKPVQCVFISRSALEPDQGLIIITCPLNATDVRTAEYIIQAILVVISGGLQRLQGCVVFTTTLYYNSH